MEAYVDEYWEPDADLVNAYWAALQEEESTGLLAVLRAEPTRIFLRTMAGLFARAYTALARDSKHEAGKRKLLEEIFTDGIRYRGMQYRLLARVRDEGNWPVYQDLLRLLNPQSADLRMAIQPDEPTSFRIYLENVTPTQDEIKAGIRAVLEHSYEEDDVDVAKLKLVLPLLQDKQDLAADVAGQLDRLPVAIALVANGVPATDPRLVQALTLPEATWPLLRNPTIWPDLPYRIVVGLQRQALIQRSALEMVLGRNLAGYVLRSL